MKIDNVIALNVYHRLISVSQLSTMVDPIKLNRDFDIENIFLDFVMLYLLVIVLYTICLHILMSYRLNNNNKTWRAEDHL